MDQIGRIKRLGMGLGDHEGDRLTDMSYTVARQRPTRRLGHRLSRAAADDPQRPHRTDAVHSHVSANENGNDAGCRSRRRDIRFPNAGMGIWRTNKCAMEFARQDDISHEAAGAAQQPIVLNASNRRANALKGSRDRCVYCNSSRSRSSRS
jgi:hypothetical protein